MQLIASGHSFGTIRGLTLRQAHALVELKTMIDSLNMVQGAVESRLAFGASAEDFTKFIDSKEAELNGD